MARIVHLTGIQGMPVGAGGFTAYLSDALCPWNEGNWRFEAVDGRLRVGRSDGADCELAIQVLTGLAFGTHSAADFAFRRWGKPTRQTQEAMQALFQRRRRRICTKRLESSCLTQTNAPDYTCP